MDAPTQHEIESFGLLSDTGPLAAVTANPALIGSVGGAAPLADLAIAIDHGDDGSVDSILSTNSDGTFVYFPEALDFGQHTIRARVATWDSNTSQFNYSAGQTTTFTLESQPNRPAEISVFTLQNPPANMGQPVVDATLVGRIKNELELEGITVEIDYDLDDGNSIDQIVTTDRLGQFTVSPQALLPGLATIRARAVEFDDATAAYLYSPWVELPPFVFEPIPNAPPILSLELVEPGDGDVPPTVSNATLRGTVVNDEGLDGLVVEFMTGDGPFAAVIGTVDVNPLTGFVLFDPDNLHDGTTYEIWARAREPLLDGSFAYSPTVSVEFIYSAGLASELRIQTFGLAQDTATNGGSTESDGSTQHTALVGQLAWGGGDVAGLDVNFDLDGEPWTIEASVVTEPDGRFAYDFQVTEPGFYSIRAQAFEPLGSHSSWRVVNFVYDTNDSSPRALALVAALELIDAEWQTADDLDLVAIRELAETVFAQGSANAEAALEHALTAAEQVRAGVVAAVNQAYQDARVAATENYQQSIQLARTSFATALANLPADQRLTYSLPPLIWPAPAFDNRLQVPLDSTLPMAPLVPSYGGPSFDPFRDPIYALQSRQAEQLHLHNVRLAEESYGNSLFDIEQQFDEDFDNAIAAYELAVQAANQHFSADGSDEPEFDDDLYREQLAAISSAWVTYRSQVLIAQLHLDARQRNIYERANQALASAQNEWSAASQAAHDNLPPAPTIAQHNAFASTIHEIDERFRLAQRPIIAERDRDLASAQRDYSTTYADLLWQAQTTTVQAQAAIAELNRQYQHDLLVDRVTDSHEHKKAMAAAQAAVAEALAEAKRSYSREIANRKFERDRQIAQSRQIREQTIADVLLEATQRWATAVGTPWATFQANLAAQQRQYRSDLVQLEFDRDIALATARKQEIDNRARANEDYSASTALAEETRAVGLSASDRDFRTNTSSEYLERDNHLTWSLATRRLAEAEARRDRDLTVAEADATEAIRRANAYEVNYQPEDVWYARCPDGICTFYGFWEYYLHEDNSEIRERNSQQHLRATESAHLTAVIAKAEADEQFTESNIAATEAYRMAANQQAAETTNDLAELRYTYEVTVAEAQDAYDVAVADSAAKFAIAGERAQAGAIYDEIVAQQQLLAMSATYKQSWDDFLATETQSYEVGVAGQYFQNILAWGETVPTAWGLYHLRLANAEFGRVSQTNAAAVAHTQRSGLLNVTRLEADVSAEMAFAHEIYGPQGAFVRRAERLAQAAIDLAEANRLTAFVTAQAEAVKEYDTSVTDATLAYRQMVIEQDAIRDRLLNQAFTANTRSHGSAYYALRIDPEVDDAIYLTLRNTANANFAVAAAQANADRLLEIEQKRHAWKHEVGDLRVSLVEQIVAAQQERAADLHEDRIVTATAAAYASRDFTILAGQAAGDRMVALARAEGAENVSAAESAALHAIAIRTSETNSEVEKLAARGEYEVQLHTLHLAAASSFQAAVPSPESAFYVDVATADLNRAIQTWNSKLLRFNTLGAVELQQRDRLNHADTRLAEDQAAAIIATNSYQAVADVSQAVSMSLAAARFHIDIEAAKAVLQVDSTAAQGDADIAYARAARDKTHALADAEWAFLQQVVPAHADHQSQCSQDYWLRGETCASSQDTYYQQLYDVAAAARVEAEERAEQAFQEEVDAIGLGETENLSQYRIAFVAQTGAAHVSFAADQAGQLQDKAVADASNQLRAIRAQQANQASYGDSVQEAQYLYTVDAGEQQVAHQQRLVDIESNYAAERGNAEAAFQIALAAREATSWHSLAIFYPANHYFEFRADAGDARTLWLGQMQEAYVNYQVAQRRTHAEYLLGITTATEDRSNRVAAAQWNSSFQYALQEQQRQIDEAQILGEFNAHAAIHLGDLLLSMAQADAAQATARVMADTSYDQEMDRISRQFAVDRDADARNEALDEAMFRRQRSFANADATWQFSIARGEYQFDQAEATRQHSLTHNLTELLINDSSQRAAIAYQHEQYVSSARTNQWIQEVGLAAIERAAQAEAEADLVTAGHDSRVVALAAFRASLAIPWAEFEFHRALQDQFAWNAVRNDFIANQTEKTQAAWAYTQERLDAFDSVTGAMARAHRQLDDERAEATAQHIAQAAEVQRDFLSALAESTSRFRIEQAQATRTYAVTVAMPDADQQEAATQRELAQEESERNFTDTVEQLRRDRRDLVSIAGAELTFDTSALQNERNAIDTQWQAAFDAALVNAYFNVQDDEGLIASQADSNLTLAINEAAARISAWSSLPSSPWADLAVAQANAERDEQILPLAELQSQQERTLAAARNTYHAAVSAASLAQSQLSAQLRVARDSLDAAGQLALAVTFDEGDIEMPEMIVPPEPDLGTVTRLTESYATQYPEIIDIESYAHGYWGGNYWGNFWGSGYILDPSWLWSSFGRYNYGWGYANYAGYYGWGSGYYGFWGGYPGGFAGYVGYGQYTPGSFVFGYGGSGWSGNYTPPPSGLPSQFQIDVAGTLSDVGASFESRMEPVWDRFEQLAPNEDQAPPRLEPATGLIQLEDSGTTFSASYPAASLPREIQGDFSVEDGRDVFAARQQDYSSLSDRFIQSPTAVVTPAASTDHVESQPYDFSLRFAIEKKGDYVYLREGKRVPAEPVFGSLLSTAYRGTEFQVQRSMHIGRYDQASGWVYLTDEFGGGRATYSSLRKAADTWNSAKMQQLIRATYSKEALEAQPAQARQLIDGVRSPFEIRAGANALGIFIGGTSMHFYGVGNVEKMYNMYQGSKFYYGGIGNLIDSRWGSGEGGGTGETIEGATALSEFGKIIDRVVDDVVDYFRRYGVTHLHIYGWSRGAAQAIEAARELAGRGITVDFVGAFDPVYSVGSAGQQSLYIQRPSDDGKRGNYVMVTVSPNVEHVVAIYAMNEVRSWFPATILMKDNGETELTRISSPGAHGEVGGHFLSNLMVQRLNLHQMIAKTPGGNTLFRNVPLDPQVQAIYDSVYTTYAALRDTKDVDTRFSQFTDATSAREWMNLERQAFIRLANSKKDEDWSPGQLGAQTLGSGGGLTGFNKLRGLELVHDSVRVGSTSLVYYATLGQVDLYELDPTIGRFDQPWLDYYKRDITRFIDQGLWELYPGIEKEFIEILYGRTINPSEGGFKT